MYDNVLFYVFGNVRASRGCSVVILNTFHILLYHADFKFNNHIDATAKQMPIKKR